MNQNTDFQEGNGNILELDQLSLPHLIINYYSLSYYVDRIEFSQHLKMEGFLHHPYGVWYVDNLVPSFLLVLYNPYITSAL